MFYQKLKLDSAVEVPEELNRLAAEVFCLYTDWQTFEELFLDAQNARLIQHTAPHFFEQIVRLFLNRFVTGVTRFVDPLQTGGKENLVLERLNFGNSPHPKIAQIKGWVDQSIRPMRNKAVAHLSLDLVGDPALLAEIRISEIKEAIELIRQVVEAAWKENTGAYLPQASSSTAIEILNYLEGIGNKRHEQVL